MKKLAFTLMILGTLAAIAYSSDKFYSSFEFAYYPIFIQQDKLHIDFDDNQTFSATILVGAEYEFLYAEGELNTYMIKSDLYMFQPYTQEYYIRAGIRLDVFEVGYEHLCAHSVDGLGDNYGYDKVYITIDTRREIK